MNPTFGVTLILLNLKFHYCGAGFNKEAAAVSIVNTGIDCFRPVGCYQRLNADKTKE